MPELPEVETIVRKLQQLLPGKHIVQVEKFHPKSFQGEHSMIEGAEIQQVSRRAKVINIHLNQNRHLLVHLKMTGQLIYLDDTVRVGGGHPTADWVQALPSKHTRVALSFADHSKLFFNDQRLFGWLKTVKSADLPLFFEGMGPDVIDPLVTPEYLAQIFKSRSVPVKQLIMDNTIMCGLGNIYACDALNVAQIHPLRPGKSLSFEEIERLLAASRKVLLKGIELGGTTFDGKYVDVDGMAGKYQSIVRVYGREGKPCLHCGTPIEKIQLGGRGTYFCPSCQV
ncbi:MAG TPA: bifunctional DNA-formamidopyrimidine glycosylase/DNA-(apurinic or apyrimidinic site) lyase [Vitreimonas sp.]|nr:bifunctional DNA-formamidopyrimidine glycosylase/DNA-(apurinic or apyrimidinic site) lyase [Vitreimonas sp.]